MTTLIIRDLVESKELDGKAMSGVFGGTLSAPSLPLFSLSNNVADLDIFQSFAVATTASNSSAINAAQGNVNGNGTQWADQYIDVTQHATADTSNLGNVDVTVG